LSLIHIFLEKENFLALQVYNHLKPTFRSDNTTGVMLVGATALASTDNAFAGGHKKKEYNQATSQTNACGNGEQFSSHVLIVS
jgi:hypothetical protein